MSENVEAAAEAPAPAPPSGKNKLLVFGVIFNMLLMAGVVAFVLLRNPGAAPKGAAPAAAASGEKPAEGHAEAPPPDAAPAASASRAAGPTVRLADFVIHLRNPEADRYARLSFEVEVSTEKEKNDFGSYLPAIRDSFISYLSDRTLEELRGSEGLSQTKQALLARLNAIIPGMRVKALYITDFVIQ